MDFNDGQIPCRITESELYQAHRTALAAKYERLEEALSAAVWAIRRDPEGGATSASLYLLRWRVKVPGGALDLWYQHSNGWIHLEGLYEFAEGEDTGLDLPPAGI